MSYAANPLRPQRARSQSGESAEGAPPRTGAPWNRGKAPKGESYSESRDWARVGIFGAGVAVGALLGVGAALLYAPQSGFETRTQIAGRARRLQARTANRWDDLGAELRKATRRGKRRVRRGVARGRWAAADKLDY